MLVRRLSAAASATIIVAGFVVGAAWGAIAQGIAGYTVASASAALSEPDPAAAYPTNRSGQSYGKLPTGDASSYNDEDLPDLQAAVGDHGVEGYLDARDLEGEEPSTPEEALAQQESAAPTKVVPVYASDGTTVVDSFTILTHDPNAEEQVDGRQRRRPLSSR